MKTVRHGYIKFKKSNLGRFLSKEHEDARKKPHLFVVEEGETHPELLKKVRNIDIKRVIDRLDQLDVPMSEFLLRFTLKRFEDGCNRVLEKVSDYLNRK